LINIMKTTTIMMMDIIQPSIVVYWLLGDLCHKISEVKPTILAAVLREFFGPFKKMSIRSDQTQNTDLVQ